MSEQTSAHPEVILNLGILVISAVAESRQQRRRHHLMRKSGDNQQGCDSIDAASD